MHAAFRPAIAFITLIGFTAGAQALESRASKQTSQSVDAVWQKVGDFCGIAKWHPAIAKCELSSDGKERTLSLKGGGSIVERLVRWNDKAHSYTYKILSGPLPVANYVSTLRVKAAKSGQGSVVSWSGHYAAKGASDAEAKKAIDGVYEAGLTALAGGA